MCCIPLSTSGVGILLKIPVKCVLSRVSQSPGSRRGSCHPCLRCLCCWRLRKAPQLSCEASCAFCCTIACALLSLAFLTCFHAVLAGFCGVACCACRRSCLSSVLSWYLVVALPGLVMALAACWMLWCGSWAVGIGCSRCCSTTSGFLSLRGPHVVASPLISPLACSLIVSLTPSWSVDALCLQLVTPPECVVFYLLAM